MVGISSKDFPATQLTLKESRNWLLRPVRTRLPALAAMNSFYRINQDLWLPRASQLIQEIMLEEAAAASAARAASEPQVDDMSDVSSVSFFSAS